MPNSNPVAAWKALKEGNERFVAGQPEHPSQSIETRTKLAAAQHPTAVVFGCADSRVAAEIIFDRGLGDLFVIRTAGNIGGKIVIGSIEYAAEHLGSNVLLVLGLAFSDVLTDAMMVENGQRLGLTGAFQAVQWAAISAASIAVGLAGGRLAEPVAELITERIRRSATELRLHGVAEDLIDSSIALARS